MKLYQIKTARGQTIAIDMSRATAKKMWEMLHKWGIQDMFVEIGSNYFIEEQT